MYNQKQIDSLKFTAVRSLAPESQFNISADGIVTFIDDTVLTEEEIQAEMTRILDFWNNQQYARLRADNYPSIADQLDVLYHQGYDGWKAIITEIKERFPKE